MIYTSPIDNFIIYRRNGEVAYKFKNGKLQVGSATLKTTGNVIDVTANSDPGLDLVTAFPADLNGNTTYPLEMIGLGNLLGANSGGTITPADLGLRGLFYETPTLSTGIGIKAYGGVKYRVLTGYAIYNGTTYRAGSTFISNGTQTAVTGTGTFRLEIPENICGCFREEKFKLNQLQYGDESSDYHKWTEGGYLPKDQVGGDIADDDTGYGWTKN